MNTDRHVIIHIVSFMENDSSYIRLMSHSYHQAAGKHNKQYDKSNGLTCFIFVYSLF